MQVKRKANNIKRITNDQNIRAWTEASKYIINKINDEGDYYRVHVLNPALFSLLEDVKGKRVLDAGCGEGYLARKLAKKGAIVTGVEPAEGLIKYAIEKEKKEKQGVTYIKADLSIWNYKNNFFDTIVSNMVFMDIPDYKSAIMNCIHALKKRGTFVISISHPCFDISGKWESEKPYVKVTNYFKEYSIENYVGVSFHRKLSEYVNLLSKNDCYIVKMLEPVVPDEALISQPKNLRDRNIPNFLIIKAVKT